MNARRAKPSFASLFARAKDEAEHDAPATLAEPPAAPLPPPRDDWSYEALQFLVDPATVRIWPGNARAYDELTPDNCRDLIRSIQQEGMQKVAAIVRPVFDDDHYQYEVIAGTRRHFAVSHLRAGAMPTLRLLVQVEILHDEAAFRFAELEGRTRRDLSVIDRARSYALALDLYYDDDVAAMARKLALPHEDLARLIRAAYLPDTLVSAFGTRDAVTLDIAEDVAARLDGPNADLVVATAQQISRAQAARRVDNLPPYPAIEVMRLIDEVSNAAAAPEAIERLALAIVGAGPTDVTIRLDGDHGIEPEMLARVVKAMIEGAAAQGIALHWRGEDPPIP